MKYYIIDLDLEYGLRIRPVVSIINQLGTKKWKRGILLISPSPFFFPLPVVTPLTRLPSPSPHPSGSHLLLRFSSTHEPQPAKSSPNPTNPGAGDPPTRGWPKIRAQAGLISAKNQPNTLPLSCVQVKSSSTLASINWIPTWMPFKLS